MTSLHGAPLGRSSVFVSLMGKCSITLSNFCFCCESYFAYVFSLAFLCLAYLNKKLLAKWKMKKEKGTTCQFENFEYSNCECCWSWMFMPATCRLCGGCHGNIGYGNYLGCMGKFFHPDCFRCTYCGYPITENEVVSSFMFHKCLPILFYHICHSIEWAKCLKIAHQSKQAQWWIWTWVSSSS